MLDDLRYHNFLYLTPKIIFVVVHILYNCFKINFHDQCSKKDIEKKHLEFLVDITSRFILTIDESNWCHGCYVTLFFRYIGYSFVVALNYMFVIKVANIIYELICFLF